MIRKMLTRKTFVAPVSAGSTFGKCRCKVVPDSIALIDLGCHAFKTTDTKDTRKVMSQVLRPNVPTR
jgi:hypothetical protein